MQRIRCPYCGEEISAAAKKCRFCGEWLTPPSEPQPQPAPAPAAPQPQPAQPEAAPAFPPGYVSPADDMSGGDGDATPGFFRQFFLNSFLRRYATFGGCASRREFWLTWVALAIVSIGVSGLAILLAALAGGAGMMIAVAIEAIFAIAILVPSLAISARRLRDAGCSPWLLLLNLIPGIGALVLLVMFCRPSRDASAHPETPSRFNVADWLTLGASILLIVIGIVMSLNSLGNGLSSGYDLGDDGDTSSWSDYNDTETLEGVEVVEEEFVSEDTTGYDVAGAGTSARSASHGSFLNFSGNIDGQHTEFMLNFADKVGSFYLVKEDTEIPLIIFYSDDENRHYIMSVELSGSESDLLDVRLMEIDGQLTMKGTYTADGEQYPVEAFIAS